MKGLLAAAALALAGASSPVVKVVSLITALKSKVESEGKQELTAYNKYACFCEDTIAGKARDISAAKTAIDALQISITKLGAELASHSVEIKQLKKDIAENKGSQREANAIRRKEFKAYSADSTEAKQSIGALSSAIKVLSGTKAKKGKKTNFLGTMQEAQLLSTVGSLRDILSASVVTESVSGDDLDTVRKFIGNPDDFLGGDSLSAVQIGNNNPFGDYAPRSDQIQGILKGMLDTFTANLKQDKAQEANQQDAFDALMETKKLEEKTLVATLQRTEKDSAEKTKQLAGSKSTRDDTMEQLDADETFFSLTKKSCKDKSAAWSERTRLRSEELQGMTNAIAILSSSDAKKTFKAATKASFLQLPATPVLLQGQSSSAQVFARLQILAAKFGSVALDKIAFEAQLGGHFDKLIHMVENMVKNLKQEQKDDIAHGDRCDDKQEKNKKEMEDLKFDINKFKGKIRIMKNSEKDLNSKTAEIGEAIKKSHAVIKEMKVQRSKEFAQFVKASKDDVEAVALLQKAINSMTKFYSDNMKKPALLQAKPEEAMAKFYYSFKLQAKPKKAPATFEGEYGGQKSESGGILAILGMIRKDLKKELKESKKGDVTAQINFESDSKAIQDALDAQTQSKADADKQLADLRTQMERVGEDKDDAKTDMKGERGLKKAIAKDCDWIKTHFKKRKQSRKLEIQGLDEAKGFLAGLA